MGKLNIRKKILTKKQYYYPVLLLLILSLTGCSDIIDGTGHMIYGFITVMLAIIKWGFIILAAIVVVGIIVNIIKSIFG